MKPPGGSHLSRGSAVRCRSQVTTVERVFTSAPASTSTRTIAAWPCAAAHISGVWPRQISPASTLAPRASSAFAASALPVWAQVCSAVSPSGPVAFGLTPALSSCSTTAALPLSQASAIGVTP